PRVARSALKVLRAPSHELEPGSRTEIPDCTRNQHLVRLRQRGHTRRNMYGDAADIAVDQLALPGVESGANLQAKRPYLLAHRARAFYGARRPVKGGKQAIARGTHFMAP